MNETFVIIIEFHENPSSGSRAVPCGQKTDGQTNDQRAMAKLTVAFHNIAPAPINREGKNI